jgi:hypothetical protein
MEPPHREKWSLFRRRRHSPLDHRLGQALLSAVIVIPMPSCDIHIGAPAIGQLSVNCCVLCRVFLLGKS